MIRGSAPGRWRACFEGCVAAKRNEPASRRHEPVPPFDDDNLGIGSAWRNEGPCVLQREANLALVGERPRGIGGVGSAMVIRCRMVVPVQRFGECRGHIALRSEEHTSELQSLMRISYAVFCLTTKS